MAVPMARAVAVAMAAHGSTVARVVVTPPPYPTKVTTSGLDPTHNVQQHSYPSAKATGSTEHDARPVIYFVKCMRVLRYNFSDLILIPSGPDHTHMF